MFDLFHLIFQSSFKNSQLCWFQFVFQCQWVCRYHHSVQTALGIVRCEFSVCMHDFVLLFKRKPYCFSFLRWECQQQHGPKYQCYCQCQCQQQCFSKCGSSAAVLIQIEMNVNADLSVCRFILDGAIQIKNGPYLAERDISLWLSMSFPFKITC